MIEPRPYVNDYNGRTVHAIRVTATTAPALGEDRGTHVITPAGDTVPYGYWIITDDDLQSAPTRSMADVAFTLLYREPLADRS